MEAISGVENLVFWPSWDDEPWADLAREELALGRAASSGPVLCAYAWNRPVLVLGYGQRPSEQDRARWRREGLPVLRRCSGGTGVLHEGRASALSLSLALPSHHPFAGSIGASYDALVNPVEEALGALGIGARRWSPGDRNPLPRRSPICFEDHRTESLLVDGRKVFGGAQARRRESVLVHGALLFSLDAAFQGRVYGVSPERILAAMGAVSLETPAGPRDVAEATAAALARRFGVEVSRETPPPPSGDLAARATDPRWVVVP